MNNENLSWFVAGNSSSENESKNSGSGGCGTGCITAPILLLSIVLIYYFMSFLASVFGVQIARIIFYFLCLGIPFIVWLKIKNR